MKSLDFVEQETLRKDLPPFRVGDAVRVHVRVKEGDKERIQVFEGLVIRRRGSGMGETFTVRKIASGVGVERIFPLQSQLVTKVEIKNRGFVRRSRLYYLRNLSGKKARLQSKVRDLSELVAPELEGARDSADNVMADEVEAVAEVQVEEAASGELRGKARKRANARQKADRMMVLQTEEEERAGRRAAEEAEKAAAEEAAASEAASEEAADREAAVATEEAPESETAEGEDAASEPESSPSEADTADEGDPDGPKKD